MGKSTRVEIINLNGGIGALKDITKIVNERTSEAMEIPQYVIDNLVGMTGTIIAYKGRLSPIKVALDGGEYSLLFFEHNLIEVD